VLGLAPVCGRSSSTGDFYIANKSGAGVFVFSGIASVPFGGIPSPLTPTNLGFNLPQAGRGITQKYVGDLLVVDNSNNKVVRSPYTVPFNAPSNFITTNLNGPVGLAAAVTTTLNPASGVFVPNSNFFVANSNSSGILAKQPPVSVFTFNDATQTGVPAAACPGLNLPGGGPPQVADYLASAPTADNNNSVINNTIYLVTHSKNSNSGSLWTWDTAQAQAVSPNCTFTPAASIGTALSGVAVGPAPVTLNLLLNATAATPTPNNFNFNSSLFQITGQGCIASVTAYPLSAATVQSMITLARLPGVGDSNAINQYPGPPTLAFPPPLVNPATPLVGLGDGGFEMAYVAHWHPGSDGNNCASVFPDGGFVTGMYNITDSTQFTNPRMLQCDNSVASTEPQLFPSTTTTCGSANLIGVYPSGGPIGLDGGGRANSVFLWVRETAGASNFCGFQSPLAGNGTTLPSPLPSFSATKNTLAVKFKISSGSCTNQKSLISNAEALLSVARVFDANGVPVFNPVDPNPTSASIDVPPIFPTGNPQYSFTLNLPSVLAQGGAGTYSVTVTFLSDNTTNQTTEFVLTP
jgi:hypothetical protein